MNDNWFPPLGTAWSKLLASSGERRDSDDTTIVLGILQAIESGGQVTQRAVAGELGIALGLVNAYVKRCMKKGLIKVRTAPARRYAYYLTPKGFSEKSRLTASYLSHSFSFFRKARTDCEAVLAAAVEKRMQQVALVGASDLAAIVILCAAQQDMRIVAVIDPAAKERYSGIPVVASCDLISEIDGLIVTDLTDPQAAYNDAVRAVGATRVLVPPLLRAGPAFGTPVAMARQVAI